MMTSRFTILTLTTVAVLMAIMLMFGGHLSLALCVGVTVCYVFIFSLGVAFPQMQFFISAWHHGNRSYPKIALTFDDGPDAKATPALLDLLDRRGVSATFFCVGQKVDQLPHLAKRIVAQGHDIGNHTYRHAW